MKKILLVNSISINSNNATGITLRSLFQNYEKKSLLEINWNGLNNDNNNSCINTYILKYSKFSIANFLNKIRNNGINNYIKKKNVLQKKESILQKILKYIRQYIALLTDDNRIIFNANDKNIIDSFHPDIIYTIGESINALKLSYKFSQIYKIPIIIHYLDNWLYSIQWENNPLLFWYKYKLRNYAKKCQKMSNVGITISDEMAEEYTRCIGITHYSLMNSINCKEMYCDTYDNTKKIFLYAGGIHLGREKILKKIADKLCEIVNSSGINIEFHIYTFENDIIMFKDFFKDNKIIKIFKAIPHEEIKNIYNNAYALIHVEQFDKKINDFFKYSISTKIPEYLSTHKPILFYGPSNIYLYKMLSNNIAYVASSDDELHNAIYNLLYNAKRNKEIADNAFCYSINHFDLKITKEKLMSIFDIATIIKK